MPIRPRSPRLPSYMQEKPFANVCNDFARLDKVEITYNHRIQYRNEATLHRYIQRIGDNSDLFAACWRPNPNRTLEESQPRIRLPNQLRFKPNEMIAGVEDVKLKYNKDYPTNVRDMQMHLSVNFQRFWQNNGHAIANPTRIRNNRREAVTTDNFNLADLFTLNPDNFPSEIDDVYDTNILEGSRWHETKDVAVLFSKQLLYIRNYIEAQFPLPRGITHAQLQRQAVGHPFSSNKPIRILSDEWLEKAGGVAPLFHWGDFFLPHLEVAYDYHCIDAMQVTQDLMMRVLGVGFATSAGFHDIYFNRADNTPCCNVNLTKGITIAIYAKAHNRVRIEMRYKKSLRSLIRRIDKNASIEEMVEEAIADATPRTIKMLKQLPSESVEPLNRTIRMTEFIQHVNHAFGDNTNRIERFLNSLAIIGSDSQPTSGDRTTYEYLVTQGILQPSRPGLRNTTVQYSIAPEYGWIIQMLGVRYFKDYS